MAGLVQLKHMFKEGDVVVVIFHDHGTRYLGKMFNDDWMRDRGFLEDEKVTALKLIERHKDLRLVTAKEQMPVGEAVALMRKYNISQIPVVNEGGDFTGALNDTEVFATLIDKPELKAEPVKSFAKAPFPFVNVNTPLEEVSKLITKDNSAVLVKDMLGSAHIITRQDIIDALCR
jgi:cystathionine beta-synthase